MVSSSGGMTVLPLERGLFVRSNKICDHQVFCKIIIKLSKLLFGQSWLTSTNVWAEVVRRFTICFRVMSLADSAYVGVKHGVQRQCYCWFPPSLRGNLFQMAGTFSKTGEGAESLETHKERRAEFANRLKRLNLGIFVNVIMGTSSYLVNPPNVLYGSVIYDKAFIHKVGLQKRPLRP